MTEGPRERRKVEAKDLSVEPQHRTLNGDQGRAVVLFLDRLAEILGEEDK